MQRVMENQIPIFVKITTTVKMKCKKERKKEKRYHVKVAQSASITTKIASNGQDTKPDCSDAAYITRLFQQHSRRP